MKPDTIVITSKVDKSVFYRFSWFETMVRTKRYRSPAVFTTIMLIFSLICFSQVGRREQAGLLGGVLLGIGILLPAIYFFNFFLSVREQAKKMGLERPKHVYTVSMTDAPDGIAIVTPTGKGGTLRVRWDQIHAVYQAKDCIYFYVSDRQAFLLPKGQANVPDDKLIRFLVSQLPAEKLHGLS
ncbi:MAG: YcxB family protein [Eubacteriales bacterium]|nr:YcxB family protein [Eubacteriales bacterium]